MHFQPFHKKVTKFSEKLHFCKNKMKKIHFFNSKNEKKCIHLIIYTISVPMTPKLSLLMIFWKNHEYLTQICLKTAIFRYMQNGDLARKCD